MSWVKDREEFKQAALSTARALTKNSTLESTTQASSRPPSSSQISLNYPPRSSKQVNSWRGEADFQTFWHTFHNDDDICDTLFASEFNEGKPKLPQNIMRQM